MILAKIISITFIFEMTVIKHPPFKGKTPSAAFVEVFESIIKNCPEKLTEYMAFQRPVDEKGRYLHFDELRYRVKPELNGYGRYCVFHATNN